MTTPSTNNFTDEDLQEVNEEIAQTLIPAMVYIAVLMLIGVCGNSLVCFVFILKMKRGTQKFLITCLAVFDLLTCFLVMPVEIADMRYSFTFNSQFACKILRFINAICFMSSIVTLVVIAIDRYLKVCRPMKIQMDLRGAKLSVGFAVCVGLVLSWPALLVSGVRTVETHVPHLYGKTCSVSDSMKNTIYPLVYNSILAFLFVGLTITLAVIYGLICMEAKRHKAYMRKTSDVGNPVSRMKIPSASSGESTTNDVQLSEIEDDKHPHHHHQHNASSKKEKKNDSHKLKDKTTVIGFTVTLVFVLSCLPYLCLVVTRFVLKDFDYDLNEGEFVTFNIFLRSYLLNSVANPIIYGVLNVRFREESIILFRRIVCCVKSSSLSTQMASSYTCENRSV